MEIKKECYMKLIKFYADWCMPCKAMTQLLREDPIGIDIVEVNIDNLEGKEPFILSLASEVKAVPTMFLVEDETVLNRWMGLISTKDIKLAIEKADKGVFLLIEKVDGKITIVENDISKPFMFSSLKEARLKRDELNSHRKGHNFEIVELDFIR